MPWYDFIICAHDAISKECWRKFVPGGENRFFAPARAQLIEFKLMPTPTPLLAEQL